MHLGGFGGSKYSSKRATVITVPYINVYLMKKNCPIPKPNPLSAVIPKFLKTLKIKINQINLNS
jgi:hypothetical protein